MASAATSNTVIPTNNANLRRIICCLQNGYLSCLNVPDSLQWPAAR